LLVKVPVWIRIQFPIRIWITGHRSAAWENVDGIELD
jgi:hypothetical protein